MSMYSRSMYPRLDIRPALAKLMPQTRHLPTLSIPACFLPSTPIPRAGAPATSQHPARGPTALGVSFDERCALRTPDAGVVLLDCVQHGGPIRDVAAEEHREPRPFLRHVGEAGVHAREPRLKLHRQQQQERRVGVMRRQPENLPQRMEKMT